MVHQKFSEAKDDNKPSESKTNSNSNIKHIYPESVEDIRNTKCPKIIIKFSKEHCGPCKMLSKWLDEYKSSEVIPVYNLAVDSENAKNQDAAMTLAAMYGVRSLPRVIFTNASLEPLDSIVGWNEEKMEELLKKHFK